MDPNNVAASARQKATLKIDGQNVGVWDAMPAEAITAAHSPDPRVVHPEGHDKPTLHATRALVASVHERMDALGVPREVGGTDEDPITGTLTLLKRMDAAIAAMRATREVVAFDANPDGKPVAVVTVLAVTDDGAVTLAATGEEYTLRRGDRLNLPIGKVTLT